MKIAERWFEKQSAGDSVTLLYEPHVHPFIRCNIWHVAGRDRDLLIDTGTGVASLGAEVAKLTDKPVTAIATHIHYDHVGSFHEFDCRIMHEAEAPLMRDYSEFAALDMARFPEDIRASLAGYGLAEEGGALIDALPHEGYDIASYKVRSVEATGTVAEGDVIDLPVGACPVDFAYAIHSEIGDHTSGAKVNNKLVGLDTPLRNGDIVEIVTKKSSHPTQKWLEFVKTSLAKRHIRVALAEKESGNGK